MIVDFEQVVGDVRYWLRNTTTPRLSRKNFTNSFGKIRRDFRLLEYPEQCVSAYELTSLVGGQCIAGAIQVQSLTHNGVAELTELTWDTENMAVRSLMTGTEQVNLVQDLPGVVSERVHTQLAIPLQHILRNI